MKKKGGGGEGEEERSATRYQMICEERKRRHVDVRCVDFQTEPWNVILIKQCTWVVVGLGNGASWKLPCL